MSDEKPAHNMTIRELYDKIGLQDEGEVDHMVCDIITTIKELPGIEEAILGAALKDNYYLRTFSPDFVGDIAFQYIWDKLMNPEET